MTACVRWVAAMWIAWSGLAGCDLQPFHLTFEGDGGGAGRDGGDGDGGAVTGDGGGIADAGPPVLRENSTAVK